MTQKTIDRAPGTPLKPGELGHPGKVAQIYVIGQKGKRTNNDL